MLLSTVTCERSDIPKGEQSAFEAELAMVWPAMRKMKQRDVKYVLC